MRAVLQHHSDHIFEFSKYAKIAQLVERDLAKVEVAGSSPVFRSKLYQKAYHAYWSDGTKFF